MLAKNLRKAKSRLAAKKSSNRTWLCGRQGRNDTNKLRTWRYSCHSKYGDKMCRSWSLKSIGDIPRNLRSLYLWIVLELSLIRQALGLLHLKSMAAGAPLCDSLGS